MKKVSFLMLIAIFSFLGSQHLSFAQRIYNSTENSSEAPANSNAIGQAAGGESAQRSLTSENGRAIQFHRQKFQSSPDPNFYATPQGRTIIFMNELRAGIPMTNAQVQWYMNNMQQDMYRGYPGY